MAIPFNMPAPDPDSAMAHYLRVQNLLRELLTLLRRMPSQLIGDPLNSNISIFSSTPPPYSVDDRDRLWAQQQQNSARAFHRRRMRERQQQRDQQQPMLPDLVTSCGQSASPRPPPPPPPSPPQQQLQAQPTADDDEDERFAGAVKLQIAVCPTCYYKERKLKVIAVSKLDVNGKPIRWTTDNRDDEEPMVVGNIENKISKVKRRIMSLIHPSKIESSVLTAMFVIIGWKMFIKQ